MGESRLPEWVGPHLGRYSVRELIGRGGMGVVLRAQDPELQRTVAVKVLYPHLAADADLVERFRREAQTAANLRHANIVAVYDVGQEKDCHYIVMEYLAGCPLSKVVAARGPLPPQEALAIAAQVAAALDFIHQRGLVHRDVKATNIIVDQAGRAVLTDFGLVETPVGRKLTVEGTVLGTPQYLAPEQLARGKVGSWTDLYALAVVTYEMLSGQVPFNADSPSALLFQVLWMPPPPICLPESGLPAGVDAVLGRALAKQPEDRYPDGASLVSALERVLVGNEEGGLQADWLASGPAVQAPSPAFAPVQESPAVPPAGRTGSRMSTLGRPLPAWLRGVLCGASILLTAWVLFAPGGLFPFQYSARMATRPAEGLLPGTTNQVPLTSTVPAGPLQKSPYEGQIEVVGVYNEGKQEHVTITNVGGAGLDLTGWSVSGSLGKERYMFPGGYILPAGRSINLYSGEGGVNHPPSDIYWTMKTVWNNAGETVYLWDAAGNAVHEYSYH